MDYPKYTVGGAGAAVGAAAFVGLMVGYSSGRGAIPDLQEWQTLVGALVAVIAVAVAWLNVQRQLRINLISREEDRIEKGAAGS
jgi:hypothetical protein